MTGQGGLFKLMNAFGSYRNILNNGRTAYYQQTNSIKQSTKDKLQELNIPDKPKKPLSAYFRYMADHKADVVRNNPTFKLTDVIKKCAADWANVHTTIKDKYMSDYKSEMEGYTKKYLEYASTLTEEQKLALQSARAEKKGDKKRRETKKNLRDLDRPKRPIGPYMQYILEIVRKENKKMPDVLQGNKGKWQLLSDSERQIYSARFEEDKKRYEKEMQVWEAKMIKEGHTEVVRHASLRDSNKPSRLLKQKEDKKE